jgi:pimeloyl-ACP methyl ester carboxylesterase
MNTYVLIPGAGGTAWYWSRVVPLLERAGHAAIAVDLPGDDESAGLAEYTDLVIAAIDEHTDGRGGVAMVAQSLGGFTAAMVCAAAPVASLTFVNAMIPVPHETPGDWWDHTGAPGARIAAARAGGYAEEFDPDTYFLHDVPAGIAAEGEPHQRPEADAVFASTCDFDAWPPIARRAVGGADDRFFPIEFQRRVARERLGIDIDVLPGGHLLALAQPDHLVEYLLQQ